MTIGIIDIDGKMPNLALMKISKYYKSLGEEVEFVDNKKNYDKIYASAILTSSKDKCDKLKTVYGDKIDIGGTGYDLYKTLPDEIENMKPDYDLYTPEILLPRLKGASKKDSKYKKALNKINSGLGITSRGCIRACSFCFVPKKEGKFRQAMEIKDIINPKSRNIILHDNNLTADPYCIDKLKEIKARKLILDLNQGCDVRIMTDEIAYYLSIVRHLDKVHFAWDLMNFENQVLEGIKVLTKHVKSYKQMCYILCGYNTTFEEDVYRFKILTDMNISPYVMKYNERKDDKRLNHFARWVNGRVYKSCEFKDYDRWVKYQNKINNNNKQLSFILS